MEQTSVNNPPGWVEIDLNQFRRNWEAIGRHRPASVGIAYVVKDDAYGHGALALARIAVQQGVEMLVVSTVQEAWELRAGGLRAPLLILGERTPGEHRFCLEQSVTPSIGSWSGFLELKRAASQLGRTLPFHLKVDTGMSRYGVRWTEAERLFREIKATPEVRFEGIMSHFAMSDELDKTFARLQLARFHEVLGQARAAGLEPRYRHLCNSGGFLDLPEAHFNLVRLGILPLGVYPSKVCQRLEGIEPIMAVKSRLAAIRELEAGDHVGYGMRYTAPERMRTGVVPIGYGFGFPRVRNQGHVLIRGQAAPIIGGVAMDAITVDLRGVPGAEVWDEVTLLGRSGPSEITIHEIAALRNSVSYEAMVSWNNRLPRRYLE